MIIFHIIFICELYIILSLCANLVSGYTGLLSFAYAAFYGIGAYSTALSMKLLGFNFFEALALGVIVNIGLSAFVAFLAVRLKDIYFTLATLSLQVIVFELLYNWETLTFGSFGISEIPHFSLFGKQLTESWQYSILGAFFLIVVLIFFRWLKKTPLLRVLTCIRDNELGSISVGKNIAYYKYVCNIIAAILMTIPGALYAVYNSYIDPSSFTLNESILIVSMILIGGTGGSLWGPIAGAVIYVLLPELIRYIPISSAKGASVQMMIYSLILILVVRFRPNGILGKFKFE
jgi:branched-chain amino acid transport system permease protein